MIGLQVVSLFILLWTTSLVIAGAYRHTVVVSNNPSLSHCKLMITEYRCGSLAQAFDLLNTTIKKSVDVTIEPAEYTLVSSHILEDLQDIKLIGSNSPVESFPVIITCKQEDDSTETGVAFIRAKNLVIQYVHVRNCGMSHESSSQTFSSNQFVYFRSAIYFQNSTNLSMINIQVYNNNGIGMAIVDSDGTISIKNSEFRNNSLNSSEQAVNFTGGGGLYIELTRCTPGLSNCTTSTHLHNKHAKYFIDQCIFHANNNTYINTEPDQPTTGRHIAFGSGGGLSVQLYGNTDDNLFFISSSTFSRNVASHGGGFSVALRHNSTLTNITIFQSSINDNMVSNYQGGGGAIIGYAIYDSNETLRYNHIMLSQCNFTGNNAPNGNGGGLAFYGSHEPNVTSSTNYIEVSQCHFEKNVAQFGSAISIAKEYYEAIPRGVLLTFIITNCSFISNNANDKSINMFSSYESNSHSWIGAIAVAGFTIQFRLSTQISCHNSTALVMDGAIMELYHDSSVTFSHNRGLKGGAMLLLQGSWIKLFSNVKMTFSKNHAMKAGGAIFVEMISPYDFLESHICFFRNNKNAHQSNWSDVVIDFLENSNPTIFASTLHPCNKEYSQNNISFLLLNPFRYDPPITAKTIATLPSQIHVLNSTISESPGRTFPLPVYLTDELNNNVTNSIFILACNSMKQPHDSPRVLSPYQYTNSSVKIAGMPTQTCSLVLQTDNNHQISTTITVNLLKCPPGYIFDDQKQQCDCIHAKLSGNPVILECDPLHFQAYVNPTYWVGFKTSNATVLAASPCPFGYCYSSGLFRNGILLTQEANKTILDQQVCGAVFRTGRLCGKCIEDYSVAMNSPEFSCQKCKHHPFGVLFFILSYIIPVTALFYVIMAYNIRVTSGLFGAFLFFAQILGSEINFAFDYRINAATHGEFVFSKILLSIYSIFNLELFQYDTFSYCLFENVGTVDILAFKLIASLYPLGLIVVYSLVRIYCRSRCLHHCLRHCRIANRAVTSGLSAFLVLCFAKINVLGFAILKQVDVAYVDSDGRWKNHTTVVYLQGNLEYFGKAHTMYAAGALIVLTVIIAIPTVYLLFHPLIQSLLGNLGWGESRLMNCIDCCLRINRLRPSLDSFQGNYKNSMKFFAGLHFFLYRTIVFCAIIATPTSSIGTLQLILTVLFLIILIIHIITNPFRNQVDNVAHSIVYLLIIVLLGILYLFISDETFSFAIYLGTALSTLPLLFLGVYILWMLSQYIKVLRARCNGYVNPDNDIQD